MNNQSTSLWSRLNPKLDRLAMALLCVLMADCCIFGGGRMLSVGAIGFRMMLLGLILVVSLPLMVARIRDLLHSPYMWLMFAFGLWILICAVVGVLRGNNRSLLISDIKGFCYFVLLPAALCILTSRKRVHCLMKVMMYSAAFLAVVNIAVLITYWISPEAYHQVFLYCQANHLGGLGVITANIPRLFFNSVVYLFCGCGFFLYFYVKEKNRILYPLLAALCLVTVLLSYTRSVYGGTVIAALVCAGVLLGKGSKEERKRLGKFVVITVAAFAIVIGAFSVIRGTNYFGFAISRTVVGITGQSPLNPGIDPTAPTDPSAPSEDRPDDLTQSEEDMRKDAYLVQTVNSDRLRSATIEELLFHIRNSPLVGHGLGKNLEIRVEKDNLNEYFYLDLWVKTGIIGVILYMLPVAYGTICWWRKKQDTCTMIWIGVLLGVMATSVFNPYMNASLGICLYCCTMAVSGLSEPQ